MAVQNRPQIQKKFGGLYTAEHPLERPPQSASLIDNFEVLPGNWLRLMSGRIGRVQATEAISIPMIMPTSLTQAYGSTKHLVQVQYNAGGVQKIIELTIASNGAFTLNEGSAVETLITSLDNTVVGNGTPWTQLPNSIIYNNGKGRRTQLSTYIYDSQPALSQWKPDGTLRYYGLYPVHTPDPLGPLAPYLTFSSGGGGFNTVTTGVHVWTGLYNSATDHYSNAIYCGQQGPTGGTGIIKVLNLNQVGYATHGASETAELYWVFYASLDGFETAYLIQNETLDGPLKISVTDAVLATGFPLSVEDDTDNGWVLDATKERPVNNYPPRSMVSMCYANGRLYGILSGTKTLGTAPEYMYTEKELSGVVWSESEGSQIATDFLGDPLQSWNPKNFTPVQAGQYPRVVFPATDSTDVIVLSATHTWLLREESKRFHRWIGASDQHGISSTLDAVYSHKCITKTRHGVVWVTQRNQLAILETGSEKVRILSADYPDAIPPGDSTVAVNCVAYVYDPINHIDRVDVHFTALPAQAPRNPFSEALVNRVLRHDFSNGTTTATVEAVTQIAGAMIGGDGQYYQVQAKQYPSQRCGLYTIEGQADQSFRIPTKVETFTSSSTQAKSTAEQIDGLWFSQWLDFGDASIHKELPHVDVLGDVASSNALGESPLEVRTFNGFTEAVGPSTGTVLTAEKTIQELGDYVYRYHISQKHKRWWKFALIMQSHAADFGNYFLTPAKEADQDTTGNFYGSVMIIMPTVGRRENRD